MRRVFRPAFFVFLALLVSVFWYIGYRIATDYAQRTVLFIVLFLIFLFPLTHFRSETHPWPRTKLFFQRASYVGMGLMSAFFVLTVIRDFMLAIIYSAHGGGATAAAAEVTRGWPLFAMAAVMTGLGIWNAYFGLRVRTVPVAISDLPPSLAGLRIVQLSDLHVGPTIGLGYVEKLVALVETLHPDLIALTGDIGDGNVAELSDAVAPLGRLRACAPVYYVPGNHEYYWRVDEWIAKFTSLGATVLLNRGEARTCRGQKIWIGGVSDPVALQIDKNLGPNPARAAEGSEGAAFKLLLSHRPGLADEAFRAGFQLQLSGHTHGGQFFPWTYVVRFFHQYSIGLVRHQSLWLYVSPGTGWWGPPIRVGTTPEVTLLTLS